MAQDREDETFLRLLPEMLESHKGQFALISGDSVESYWDTEDQAFDAGDERFGLKPYLVMKVQREQPVLWTVLPNISKPQCQP